MPKGGEDGEMAKINRWEILEGEGVIDELNTGTLVRGI